MEKPWNHPRIVNARRRREQQLLDALIDLREGDVSVYGPTLMDLAKHLKWSRRSTIDCMRRLEAIHAVVRMGESKGVEWVPQRLEAYPTESSLSIPHSHTWSVSEP